MAERAIACEPQIPRSFNRASSADRKYRGGTAITRRQITTAANRTLNKSQIRTPSKIDTGERLSLFRFQENVPWRGYIRGKVSQSGEIGSGKARNPDFVMELFPFGLLLPVPATGADTPRLDCAAVEPAIAAGQSLGLDGTGMNRFAGPL